MGLISNTMGSRGKRIETRLWVNATGVAWVCVCVCVCKRVHVRERGEEGRKVELVDWEEGKGRRYQQLFAATLPARAAWRKEERRRRLMV